MTRILDILFWPYRIVFRWFQLIRNACQEVKGAVGVSLLFGITATFVAAWFFWPDHEPAADYDLDNATENAWIPGSLGFFAVTLFAIVHCFLVKSQREHLRFSLALPARRWELYLSRVIGVWLAQAVVLGILYALGLAILSLTEISTMPDRCVELLENTAKSDVLITFIMTGFIIGLTATRLAFPWLLILWMLGGELFPDWLKWLSVDSISEVYTEDDPPVINWKIAGKVIPVALIGYFIGYLCYRPKEGAVADGTSIFSTLRRGIIARRRGILAFSSLFVLGIAGLMIWQSDAASRSHTETGKLVFSFEEEDEELLTDLINQGDVIYSEVREFFQPPDEGQKVGVVITDVFDGTGVGGVANWKTVRLARSILEGEIPSMDPPDVLRHELTHVFLELLSEGKLREYGGNIKAFHEGVATLSESLPNRDQLTDFQLHRLIMATVKEEWYPIELEDLLAFEGSNLNKHGGMIAYSHGFILAQAIVETFGEDAPSEIAKAAARLKRASVLYSSEAFWHLILNEAGYSYEKLELGYKARFAAVSKEYQQYVEAMPLPKSKSRWDSEGAIIEYSGDSPAGEGATFVAYVNDIPNYPEGEEPDNGEPDDVFKEMLAVFRADENGEIRIPLDRFEDIKKSTRYVSGWEHPDLEMPVMGSGGRLEKGNAEKSETIKSLLSEERFTNLVSAEGKKSFPLRFKNNSGGSINIFSRDSEGKIWPEMELLDGVRGVRKGVEGSTWVVMSEEGKILEALVVPKEERDIEVNAWQKKRKFIFEAK